MRKVKNRKVIRNLSDKSFHANRARNLIAALAIALTAMLFTSLFTIGIGTMENFQLQTMMQAGGDSHGVIKNITEEQYEALKDHPLIQESAPCMLVADKVENPEFLKRHVEMWYYPEYHYPHCFLEIIDGRAPQAADEIVLDEVSLSLLGKEPKAGQKVTLALRIKSRDEEAIERTFTVSGVARAASGMNVGFGIVSEAYKTAHADELVNTYEEDGSGTGVVRMDVMFSNSFGIQDKLDRVIEESGYSVTEGAEGFVESNANWAYISDGGGTDPMALAGAAGGLLLILLTGYLIIYNVFQISVMKDIRYYGLLKTIGTTGRQVRQILKRQALRLCLMGIPAGLILGFLIGRWIVPMMLDLTVYGGGRSAVSMNPLIFAGAAAFALITVFISIRKPAKIAAGVSPVEAARYTDGSTGKRKQKKSTDGGRPGRMALSNIGRSKKRTAVVIVSLSLAVVLLNCIFTLTHSFDMDTYLKKFISSDVVIANAVYFNYEYRSEMGEEEIEAMRLSDSFIEACEAQDGFKEGGRIYGARYQIGLDAGSYEAPDTILRDENGDYYNMYGNTKQPFFKINDTTYDTAAYGLEDFSLETVDVWEGEKDIEAIREGLQTGDFILYAAKTDDNGFVYEDKVMHHAGDRITLVLPDGTKKEVEVLSVIKESYYGLSDRRSSTFTYYTSADIFKEWVSDRFLMSYACNVEDDKEEAFNQFLERYTEEEEPLMSYESKQFWLDEYEGMMGLIVLVGGMLTLVIAVIGLLNFINSILTGMVTRQKEFAMMEAIGMTRKQLVKMLILEGLYYAIFTIAASFSAGCIFSLTAMRSLVGGLWFLEYSFVIWPMFAVFPVMLCLGALVPWLAYKGQRKRSLVDEIRENV